MRIVIIGAVAAGTSAAAKARRNSKDSEIVIYEKDNFISYSGCGMPYYIGGEVESAGELTPRDPVLFKSKYNVDIHTLHEVVSIHPDEKKVSVRNLSTDTVFTDYYDRLVLSTGARAVIPPIKGDSMTGGSLEFRGILGTGIIKIFDMTVAQTGLSEREAREMGYVVAVCHNIKPNKPEYMGGKEMVIKEIADKVTGRLLGAQIAGYEGVDKRIDVFVAAITFKAKVEDLFHLDLAYAPPFSTTKDPVMYTGMILDNAIHNSRPLMTAQELDALIGSGEKYTLIDARVVAQYEKNHIETAKSIPHNKLRTDVESLDKNAVAVTYCNKGVTGNAAQNILLGKGIKKVYNLSGGQKQYSKTHDKK